MTPPTAKRRTSSVSTTELARHLDVNKYYQPWLDSRRLKTVPADTGPDETRPVRYSYDTTLTALAQLAALRLNVKRAMVSLIDLNTQIILAEATQTVSLVDERRHAPDDHIWLGNVSIPRQECMDEHAFGSITTWKDADGQDVNMSALVVKDTLEDDRFKLRPCVTSGASIRFYAGVPIVTKQGHAIGVYAVSDIQPRPQGITLDEVRFMDDVAQVVADHLERVMDTVGRVSERDCMRGISYFLEDLSEYKYQLSKTDRFSQPSNTKRQSDVQVTEPQNEPSRGRLSLSRLATLSEPTSTSVSKDSGSQDRADASRAPRFSRGSISRGNEIPDPADDNIRRIFTQASQLLCQQAKATGCIFADAAIGVFSGQPEGAISPHADIDHADVSDVNFESTEDEETEINGTGNNKTPSPGCKSNIPQAAGGGRLDEMADILSMTVADGNDDTAYQGMIKRKNLKKLILRYPFGKCFYLNRGRVVSDQSLVLDEVIAGGGANHFVLNTTMQDHGGKPHKLLPQELLRTIPDAKWLIFLPLFYYARGKWYAAGFIYGNDFKMGDPDDALPYFKTFGSCMMSEVASMEVLNTNIAKSTFIASISHDLRSPLHGMLGSLEFLEDTMTSAYQTSLIGAVETCGKTLLDTIDHLLDYAKINNLNRAGSRLQSSKGGKLWRDKSEFAEPVLTTFDLALLLEEVVEAVFAGQTFRKINLRHHDPVNEATAHIKAMGNDESPTEEQIHSGSVKFSGKVFLVLHIQKLESWCLQGQTGGLRRAIMNVVGNAIKYCKTGCIDVSLKSKQISESDVEVEVSVDDTGIGMSQNFLSNHLFKAFSQEDSFTSGTGLGLSITSQIIKTMGGGVKVDSEKGVGTHVHITIPMKIAAKECDDDGVQGDALHDIMKATAGKRICFLGPVMDSKDGSPTRDLSQLESSIVIFCREWFNMEIIEANSMDADVDTAIYIYAEPPPIEYLVQQHRERREMGKSDTSAWLIICTNAFEAAALRAAGIQDLVALGRIIEVISQPVGVRKLGKVLLQCLQCIEATGENADQSSRSRTPSPSTVSNHHHEDAPESRRKLSSASHSQKPARYRPTIEGFKWKSEQLLKMPLHRRPGPTPRPTDESSVTPTQRTRTQSMDSTRAPPRVLLVDDNTINLKLLVTFMSKIELPYVEATNGQEAVAKYREALDNQPFDFVLMDLQMPVMDGLEATRRIRDLEEERNPVTAPATIIAITGVGNEDVRLEAMEAGMTRFLTKPIKFKALQQILVEQSTGGGEVL
ncbi:hypothetical protein F4804DRAFT_46331 [Jackrogersella minutella]|nr:hypothetical protein F4804DRAFT_46331 [Jackrogersella minutella]